MNAKSLLFCSLVTLTAVAGCTIVSDKPADTAPPPPAPAAPATATADPAATTTAAPTSTESPGVLPALGSAPRSDAGAAGTAGTTGQ